MPSRPGTVSPPCGRKGTARQPAKTRVASPAQPSDDLQTQLDMLERALLLQALQATQFNRTAAAERLGLNLRQMRYRMARLNIERSDCDENADDGN